MPFSPYSFVQRTPNSRQTPPCPQAFVSLMQLFNLWPCGAIFFIIYQTVTVIFSEILPHATFGDPIQRKKGIVGFSPNYPFFLGIWSERLDSNQRLPAPKAGALPGCATLRKKTRAVACAGAGNLWGERWDLNPRPPGPQPGALPTELLPPRESSYKQDNFFWQDFFGAMRSGFYLEKKLHSANRRKRQPAGPYRPWTASRQCPLPLVRARSRMPDGIKHHMINIGRKAA